MFTVLEENDTSSQLTILGSVRDVLEGGVTVHALHSIDTGQFQYALGAGTFSNEEQIGETIVLNGKVHISWVNNNQVMTDSQAHFYSPFLMGIDANQTMGVLIEYQNSSHLSLETIYEELLKIYASGFAIIGYAATKQLYSTYLKKPPIFHENINQKHDIYWAKTEIQEHKPICFFGVVIPLKAQLPLLEKGFYQNPNEKHVSPFNQHTHGAILNSILNKTNTSAGFFDQLKRAKISGVRHLLTSSLIQQATCALFPIEKLNIR